MFLEKVIVDVLQEYSDIPTEKISFIVPNQRSILFLKKYFAKHIGRVAISPEFISIGNFMERISECTTLPNMQLLFELYDTYSQYCKIKKDDFETFIGWGQTLLQDFNEIDMYLIEPSNIFPYIKAVKEIEHWSLGKKLSPMQQKHLDFWNTLGDYYHDFEVKSKKSKSGYRGFVYKQATQKIDVYCENHSDRIHIFVGFNALSKSEQKVIEYILTYTKSQIYWDIDSDFIKDPMHDAGLFIREYFKWKFYNNRPKKWIENNFSKPKNIKCVGVPKYISQAHYLATYLQSIANTQMEKTAVILADESMLLTVVQSISSSVPINITMGYPLKQTPLNDFFATYFKLYTREKWYYKDIINLLTQPYLKTIISDTFLDKTLAKIRKKNRVYLFKDQLMEFAQEDDIKVLNLLFLDSRTALAKELINHSLSLISMLKEQLEKLPEKNVLLLEYLYRFYQLFNQLSDLQNRFSFLTTAKTLLYLYNDLLTKQTLDFQGEPLEGLQLMGLLESQNLDFENVIILSVNEGILPSGKNSNSFIPFDVKNNVGLPTYKHRDAIFTYHFYRLIQRAKNILLIYNTENDSLKGGEKSRFILQLKAFKEPSFNIEELVLAPKINASQQELIRVQKSFETIQRLTVLAQSRGFSPTALTQYIRNPIDFYLQQILKVYQEDEVEEIIESRTFGNIIHYTLEKLYEPLIGKILVPEDIDIIKEKVPVYLQDSFEQLYREEDYNTGKNLLIYNVIQEYIYRFLTIDKENISENEVKIIALEHKLKISIKHPDIPYEIYLNGTVDRIETRNKELYIIDFKTGKVELSDVILPTEKWNELLTEVKYSKAFQLLMYAYLVNKSQMFDNKNVYVGNYSFKNLEKKLISFKTNKYENTVVNQELLNLFQEKLFELLSEIFNSEVPFTEKIL